MRNTILLLTDADGTEYAYGPFPSNLAEAYAAGISGTVEDVHARTLLIGNLHALDQALAK